jgi:cysteine-rich repeat protein
LDNDCDGILDEGLENCCGDGIVQIGEECDDGNLLNLDRCTNQCSLAKCGDLLVQAGEMCDDGNLLNDDSCTSSCHLSRCGDGIMRDSLESCDDGNTNNNDSCTNLCTIARCGDAFVQDGIESCDDGNTNNNDGCTNLCTIAGCGDGFVQDGIESCDDGNTNNNDSCTNLCTIARCGDGFVQDGIESCDDGNTNNNDGCTNLCNVARCGDGFVQNNVENCDDGNLIDTDICTNLCESFCANHCPLIEMILIQAGSFDMGSNTLGTYTQPTHTVQIRNDFYVGKTEVTVEQYRTCVNARVCTLPSDGSNCTWTRNPGSKDNHPINCIDKKQARIFAKWVGGDLLSEVQWEYVATAQGQMISYPWGNGEPTCQLANFWANPYCVNLPNGSTSPVCSTIDGNTAQGVCDIAGNVGEWVLDDWHDSYIGSPENEQAWCDDIECKILGAWTVFRGGAWSNSPSYLRSAFRWPEVSLNRNNRVGFRISKSIP